MKRPSDKSNQAGSGNRKEADNKNGSETSRDREQYNATVKEKDELQQLVWMLKRKNLGKSDFVPDYGDLSLLNRDGLILKTVGREQLQDIVSEYLDLLETSAAVYERNGDYALGMFTSGWCQLMDSSSRKLCNTSDNLEALQSGKWLCHESCWQDASLACIRHEKPVDVPCAGGLRLYAMPVKAGGKIVGAINFGYGDPPSDEAKLNELANKYAISMKELRKQAKAYKSRPPFIVDLAKRQIQKSARYIGNIIDQKFAEKAALENEQKLHITLNSIGDAVIATDTQAKITLMNPEAERLCGCTLGQAKGKNLADVFNIVNALTGEKAENPVKQALQSGRVVGLANHTKLISNDGNEYQVADSASPIRDEQGNISGVVMVFRDVTGEYQMREELKASEERLSFAMMVKNDGMWDWDLITNTTFFDDRYFTMAGYAPGDFPKTFTSWARKVHPDDLQMAKGAIKAYLSGASDNFDIEFRFRKKDGEWMWIQGKGKIIERDAKGKPLRMLGTHTDITDRKKAEIEVQKSKEQLMTILNGINAFVYIADMETHELLFVNETGIKVWGKDITGKKCYDTLQGFDKPCSFCTNNKLIDENGQPTGVYEWEFQNRVNNRWYALRDSAIRWADERVVRLEVAIDITDQKQSQQKIQQSEERFQKMLALIPDMISIHDKDFNIVYSNWKGFAAVDEAKRNLHTKCYKTYRDMDAICPDCRAKEVLQTKKAFQTEAELPDGTWIDLRVIPVLDNNGEIELFVEWVRDITEHKKSIQRQQMLYQVANETVFKFNMNELLAAIEQQLSQLVDTTNFYVALYDAETGMLSAPFEKDEKDGIDTWPAEKSATGLVIKEKKSLLLKKCDVLTLIETGEIKQTGSICEAWLGVPIFSGNEVSGVIVVQSYERDDAFDHSSMEILEYVSNQVSVALERTRIFEDLLQAKDKAEESDRLKSAFLANVSHEIRTPMNSILGFLDILEEPQLDEERKSKFIKVINKSAQRLLVTINDIVELSKIEAGQVEMHSQDVNLRELLQEQYIMFTPQAREKGLVLNISENIDDAHALISADKHKLEGILINLINNAIKFTHKGSIEFGSYSETDQVVFFVKDTGTGIPEDKLDAVFERFVQADTEITRGHEGSGLGLSIVKAYVELLNGKIWVESEVGKGSTFWFSVPFTPASEQQTPVDQEEASPQNLDRHHNILIAEDDDAGYFFLETILTRASFSLTRALSGEEAIKLFRENPGVSLILMDLKMEGIGGLEAVREIRKFNTQVPIIAQTAHALEGDKKTCIEAGCNAYISKPIKRKELLNLIRMHAQKH